MAKRPAILLLLFLLLLGGCDMRAKPKAPAYDPEVAAMLEGYDRFAGTPQWYGFPPSFAPEEVWEAVRSAAESGRFDPVIYTTLYGTGLTREWVAAHREDIRLVGGYQCWTFRSDEAVLREKEDLFGAIRLTDDWCFVLFYSGTPVCFVTYSGSGVQKIGTTHRYMDQMQTAVREFTALYSEDRAGSPVLLYLVGSEGENHLEEKTLLAVVKTEEPLNAYVSSYGFTDSASLLRYERQRVLWTGRMTKRGINVLSSKRQPYWRGFAPEAAGTVSPAILLRLALGFGVYLALLLCGTILAPALLKRRPRRRRGTQRVKS